MKKSTKLLFLASLVVVAMLYASQGPVYSDAKGSAKQALKIAVVDLDKVAQGSKDFIAKKKKLDDQAAELKKELDALAVEIDKAKNMLKSVREGSDAWWTWADKHDALLVKRKSLEARSTRTIRKATQAMSIEFAAALNAAIEKYGRTHKVDLVLRRDPKPQSMRTFTTRPVLYAAGRVDASDAIVAILNKKAGDGN